MTADKAGDGPGGRCRAAVLGHPVAHSLSPVLHRAAYAALGLQGWTYDLADVTVEQLPGFVAGLDPTWAGLSLTMPLKKAVFPLLDTISPLAAAVGAVNTVTWPGRAAPEGGVGDNTDVLGILAALAEAGLTCAGSAVVLGGGATAASAVAAALELGCAEPVLRVRSPERARDTLEAAERLGARPVTAPLADAWHDLDGVDVVVSTVPSGASADLATALDTVAAARRRDAALPVLVDVVYAPWPTALAAAWQRHGGTVVGGLSMLVHQAVEQVRLMTGHAGPLEAMRAAGRQELARREGCDATA